MSNNRIIIVLKKLYSSLLVALLGCLLIGIKVKAYDEVVVVIDPGHGGDSNSAEGEDDPTNLGASYHDLYEKDINLATALALRDELSEYGNVTVYMTREDDKAISIKDRADYAASVGADVLISVHYNASANHNLFGSEIFTSAFDEYYATGHGLASCIIGEWKNYGNTIKDIKTRIGKAGTDYYGLIRFGRENGIPTIILEHAYLDNDRDFTRIDNESKWRELGVCDAKGIAAYYGLEKGVVKSSVGPTVDVSVPDEIVMPDDTPPVDVEFEVTEYNAKTGDVKFILNAHDEESKIMFYGLLTGKLKEDTVFPKLEIWEGDAGKLEGSCHVSPEYKGPITAVVYNSYNLDTRSESVMLDPAMSVYSEEEDTTEEPEEEIEEIRLEPENKEIVKEIDFENAPNDALEDKEVVTLGTDESKISNEEIAKAIDSSMESTVNSSLAMVYIIGLVASIIVAVCLVLLITNSVNKKKKRNRRENRERKSYDWIDYD